MTRVQPSGDASATASGSASICCSKADKEIASSCERALGSMPCTSPKPAFYIPHLPSGIGTSSMLCVTVLESALILRIAGKVETATR